MHTCLGIKFVLFGRKDWNKQNTNKSTGRFAFAGFISKATKRAVRRKVYRQLTRVRIKGTNKHRCQVNNRWDANEGSVGIDTKVLNWQCNLSKEIMRSVTMVKRFVWTKVGRTHALRIWMRSLSSRFNTMVVVCSFYSNMSVPWPIHCDSLLLFDFADLRSTQVNGQPVLCAVMATVVRQSIRDRVARAEPDQQHNNSRRLAGVRSAHLSRAEEAETGNATHHKNEGVWSTLKLHILVQTTDFNKCQLSPVH